MLVNPPLHPGELHDDSVTEAADDRLSPAYQTQSAGSKSRAIVFPVKSFSTQYGFPSGSF